MKVVHHDTVWEGREVKGKYSLSYSGFVFSSGFLPYVDTEFLDLERNRYGKEENNHTVDFWRNAVQ